MHIILYELCERIKKIKRGIKILTRKLYKFILRKIYLKQNNDRISKCKKKALLNK